MTNEEFWIQTYSKKKFVLNKPKPEMVNIIDIAHSLSQQVRFVGHLQRPLSVAQHSLTVSACLQKEGQPARVCLQGLLHDAHEAYVGDISKPYRYFLRHTFNIQWDSVEDPIKEAIGEKLGVELVNIPSIVHDFDQACLRTEAESLWERAIEDWTKTIPLRLEQKVKVVLGCKQANDLYIETYKKLKSKIK